MDQMGQIGQKHTELLDEQTKKEGNRIGERLNYQMQNILAFIEVDQMGQIGQKHNELD